MINSVIEAAANHLTAGENICDQLKQCIENKEVNSYEQRWEAFMLLQKLGGTHTAGYRYLGFNAILHCDVFMYEGMVHCDRYQTVDLVQAITTIMEGKTEKIIDRIASSELRTLGLSLYGDYSQGADVEARGRDDIIRNQVSNEVRDRVEAHPRFATLERELCEQLMSDLTTSMYYDW